MSCSTTACGSQMCGVEGRKPPDNSVGLDKRKDMMQKRKDLIATKGYNETLQNYGVGTLRNKTGGQVNGPIEARQMAQRKAGQSYNDQTRRQKTADRFGMRRK